MTETNINKSDPSNFELVLPKLPLETTLSANEELIISIYSTVIPGITLNVDEQHFMSAKSNGTDGSITFEPWSFQFAVDSNFANWYLLYRWMVYISNNRDNFGREYSDYMVDATLRITDNFRNEIFKLKFKNVWISGLAEVTLSHREGNNLLECNATFMYDRYETIL
jgi:hypothetical protein